MAWLSLTHVSIPTCALATARRDDTVVFWTIGLGAPAGEMAGVYNAYCFVEASAVLSDLSKHSSSNIPSWYTLFNLKVRQWFHTSGHRQQAPHINDNDVDVPSYNIRLAFQGVPGTCRYPLHYFHNFISIADSTNHLT